MKTTTTTRLLMNLYCGITEGQLHRSQRVMSWSAQPRIHSLFRGRFKTLTTREKETMTTTILNKLQFCKAFLILNFDLADWLHVLSLATIVNRSYSSYSSAFNKVCICFAQGASPNTVCRNFAGDAYCLVVGLGCLAYCAALVPMPLLARTITLKTSYLR